MKHLIARLKEPSTYAGLMGIAIVLGISTEDFTTYINVLAGVFGFISIVLKDPGS